MDIALMYDSWGLTPYISAMLEINARHDTDRGRTSLRILNRLLLKAYHPDEIPGILRDRSPVLGSSILEFLTSVDHGAEYLIEIIESGR